MDYEQKISEEMTEVSTGKAGVNNKKKIFFSILAVVVVLAAAYFVFFFRLQRWSRITYELGTELDENIAYYMKGTPLSINRGILDTDNVDNMKVGTYYATVAYRYKTYTYEIAIEDTVAPEIKINPDLTDINIGIEYELSRVLNSATDLSGPVEVWFTVEDKPCDIFLFDERRNYDVSIYAIDINSNVSVSNVVITAVDTIAPEITGFEGEYPYYAVDDKYGLYDFVSVINDNSGSFETTIAVNGETVNEVCFADLGEFEVTVQAVDEAGNVCSFPITVNADYKPVLYGISDKTLKVNTEYNFLEGIVAWDNEEGFITSKVEVSSEPDLSKEGEYSVVYTVTDNHGLKREESIRYTISKKDHYTYVTYPDELIDKMFDADGFSYDLLTEKDQEAAAILMYPCQVAFEVPGSFKGSGFIYKIDKDYIYFGTMGHCISKKMKTAGINIWFYNPTYESNISHSSTKRCLENLIVDEITSVYNKDKDIGMFKVARDKIPNDILIYLKEVNKTNEFNISLTNGIYTDTIYVAKNMYTGRFQKSFSIFRNSGDNADLTYLYDYYPQYKNTKEWLQTKESGVAGQSGSLLYDGYGNPVASLSGKTTYKSYSIGRHMLFDNFADMFKNLTEQE